MPVTPERPGAISFIDEQNLCHASKEAFGYPYPKPLELEGFKNETDLNRFMLSVMKVPQEIFDVIPVQSAYCPHCRTVTNLRVSTNLLIEPGPDGNAETVTVRTYHCEACCLFVRSEKGGSHVAGGEEEEDWG